MKQVSGRCQCGAVSVVAEGDPLRVGICHCHDCQRHHGALFYAAAIFPEDAVQVRGETRDYKGRHFCPVCGSSVFAQSGDEIEVHLGILEEADHLVPSNECWTTRRAPWLPAFPGMNGHDRDRDGDG